MYPLFLFHTEWQPWKSPPIFLTWVLYWFFCLYTLQNRAASKPQEFLILGLGLTVSRTLHIKDNFPNWKCSLRFRDTHVAKTWNGEQFLPCPLLLFWLRTVHQCYLVQERKRRPNWKRFGYPGIQYCRMEQILSL